MTHIGRRIYGRNLPRPAVSLWLLALAAGALPLCGASAASAALLSVTFDDSTKTQPSQQGFSTFPVGESNTAGASVSNTFGSFTVALGPATGTASISARERSNPPANSGAFTYSAMYQDFAFDSGSNGSVSVDSGPLNITLGGFIPGTSYAVTFYAWDTDDLVSTGTSTVRFTNTTTGTQPTPTSATEAYRSYHGSTATTPASNQSISATLTATADSSGNLKFTEVAVAGSEQVVPVLDGLEVSLAPEPASLGLLAMAGLGLLARRRKLR